MLAVMKRSVKMAVMSKKRIIIIEDEQDMSDLLAMRFRREQFDVHVALDGQEGLDKVKELKPDIVLLDLMLPSLSGNEIASAMRADPKTSHIPIIMLTAKSEESDIVVGLHIGADDYVTKPFSMSVLVARVQAILRRAERGDIEPDEDMLCVGEIEIDQQKHNVTVQGKQIALTLTEFKLLTAVILGRGRVLTRDQLIDKALGQDAVVTDRTIDVHLTALRRKLGDARKYIETVRGVGYRLASD